MSCKRPGCSRKEAVKEESRAGLLPDCGEETSENRFDLRPNIVASARLISEPQPHFPQASIAMRRRSRLDVELKGFSKFLREKG